MYVDDLKWINIYKNEGNQEMIKYIIAEKNEINT